MADRSRNAKLKGFKERLPTRTCEVCQKIFSWRKKWKTNWGEVKYCSDRCRSMKQKSGLKV